MRGPCEVCADHGVIRPMRERRDVQTEQGLMKMDCCGMHSMALTRSIAAHVREMQEPLDPSQYWVECETLTAHRVQ